MRCMHACRACMHAPRAACSSGLRLAAAGAPRALCGVARGRAMGARAHVVRSLRRSCAGQLGADKDEQLEHEQEDGEDGDLSAERGYYQVGSCDSCLSWYW